jgi:hypothetical protein
MFSPPLLLFVFMFPSVIECDLQIRVQPGGAAQTSTPSPDSANALSPSSSSSNGVYAQVILGNSSTDTVQIDFTLCDGSAVTALTDFRMQSQIVRVILPGEEELAQPKFQVGSSNKASFHLLHFLLAWFRDVSIRLSSIFIVHRCCGLQAIKYCANSPLPRIGAQVPAWLAPMTDKQSLLPPRAGRIN